jgi:hypothetical protein
MQVTSPKSSFTRPANTTAYVSGNLIANNTTAGLVVPLSWATGFQTVGSKCQIKRATIFKSGVSVALFKAYLHLFGALPVPTVGDGAAFATSGAASYLGYILCDGTTNPGQVFTDGAAAIGSPVAGNELSFQLQVNHTIYGLLQANAAYVPLSAEVFTVSLDLIEFVVGG